MGQIIERHHPFGVLRFTAEVILEQAADQSNRNYDPRLHQEALELVAAVRQYTSIGHLPDLLVDQYDAATRRSRDWERIRERSIYTSQQASQILEVNAPRFVDIVHRFNETTGRHVPNSASLEDVYYGKSIAFPSWKATFDEASTPLPQRVVVQATHTRLKDLYGGKVYLVRNVQLEDLRRIRGIGSQTAAIMIASYHNPGLNT